MVPHCRLHATAYGKNFVGGAEHICPNESCWSQDAQDDSFMTSSFHRHTVRARAFKIVQIFSVNQDQHFVKYKTTNSEIKPTHLSFKRSMKNNLRSGVPFVFVGAGKERLIQLLGYSSVASPQSGLFSDWSRNKRVLRTKP